MKYIKKICDVFIGASLLLASSLFRPWSDMAAVSEVLTAIRKLNLQVAPALVGRDDDTFSLPAKRFGVLDDHWCARRHILDGPGAFVSVRLVVVLLALSLHLCVQDVDGLVG